MRACALALVVACFAAPASAVEASEVRALSVGHLIADASVAPPAEGDPRWVPVSLPDTWRETRGNRTGFAWYRLPVPGPAPSGERWAVLIPRLNLNAEVYVNGEPVGSGGRMTDPVAHNFNRPLLLPFPSSLLGEARNRIDVRLFAYSFGQLRPVWIGPETELRSRYERLYFQQIRLSEIATVLAVVMVLFIGALWVGTSFDPVYGYFALATACWAVTGLNYWVREIPVGHWTWERIVHAGIPCFVVALALWVHRFLGLERPQVERILAVYCAAALSTIALLPEGAFYPWVNAVHAVALPVGAYTALAVGRRLRRFRTWEATAYVLGGGFCLAMASHDLAIQLGWLESDGPHLLPYTVPFMLLAFGTTLVGRFVASLGRAEQLGRELEDRVEQKHAELEESYARQRELERTQLLARERERIMREMHDGLGGQLVSALAIVERGAGDPEAVAGALRAALGDMRLVIDSLDPGVTGLDELLGMLRLRLEPLLRPSGMRFSWNVCALPAPPGWGAEQYLHVMRIVQEAVTNVVKHANARVVTVATASRDGEVRIEIRDDGCGGAEATAGGRGIASMQERARRLGGELRVTDAGPGTLIELRLLI